MKPRWTSRLLLLSIAAALIPHVTVIAAVVAPLARSHLRLPPNRDDLAFQSDLRDTLIQVLTYLMIEGSWTLTPYSNHSFTEIAGKRRVYRYGFVAKSLRHTNTSYKMCVIVRDFHGYAYSLVSSSSAQGEVREPVGTCFELVFILL